MNFFTNLKLKQKLGLTFLMAGDPACSRSSDNITHRSRQLASKGNG